MKTFKKLLAGVLVILTLSGCASSVKPMTDSSENEASANTDILIHQVISIDNTTELESIEVTTEVTEPTEPTEEPTQPTESSEPVTEPTQTTEPSEPVTEPTNPTEPPHVHNYTAVVTKAPTCTETGIKTYTCACGASYTETIPALGHDMGNWVVTSQPTCTSTGSQERSCKRTGCSYKETGVIPATDHDWSTWTQSVAPSCETAGKEQRYCKNCDIIETRTVNALGHNWDNGTVTTQPTCGNAGVRTYHCKRTGCSKTKTEVIPATGNHSWKQTQAPTCTNNGTETCSVCHKTRTVNALGHDWEYHPAETETVSVFYCDCGAKFYSYEDWNAHSDSYWGTDDEDNHCGYMATSEDHVIKPAYNKCKRCGMETPA